MAAEIRESLDIDTRLIPGSRGIFDVIADGQLIYSKAEEGGFPEGKEVIGRLRRALASSE